MNRIPKHALKIRRGPLNAEVFVYQRGGLLAVTTLDRDVTRESESVKRFIRKVFHVPEDKK